MNACENIGRTPAPRSQILPPADLNELEKAEFVNVVLGSPPSHFLPADIATIAAYARAVVAERRAAGELDARACRRWPQRRRAIAVASDLARPAPGLHDLGAAAQHQPRRSRGDQADRAGAAALLLRTPAAAGGPR